MDHSQNLYAILGIAPEASDEDIRHAYHGLARRLHPDANHHVGAISQFRTISEAYTVLNNASARQKYDRERSRNSENTKTYLSLHLTPSKRVLPALSEPQVIYVLVELQPAPSMSAPGLAANTPLNLTLIIDQSTSMKGHRLERTKIAAYQIIDQLSNKDIVSMVSFSDRAVVMVKAAPVNNKAQLKAMITPLQTGGGTAILQGLTAGVEENLRHRSSKYVNHIILITDGHTYGDEAESLNLADKAIKDGIGISALGIGDEWNDTFLDQLASRTGGASQYISSPSAVVDFLNEHVRALSQSLAERLTLSLAPDPDVKIEAAYRLSPNPQQLNIDSDPIQIGQLKSGGQVKLLLQMQLPETIQTDLRSLLRVELTGDVMREQQLGYKLIADTSIEIADNPEPEQPPMVILDALGKLTLYRMQQKAADDLARGDTSKASRRLETLATRLLSAGQPELANAALSESRRLSQTNMISDEGQKTLKYGTRLLLAAPKESGS